MGGVMWRWVGGELVQCFDKGQLLEARVWFAEREQEICTLRRILRKDVQDNWGICKRIEELKVACFILQLAWKLWLY